VANNFGLGLELRFEILQMNCRLGRMSLVVGLADLFDFGLRLNGYRLGRAMRLDRRRVRVMLRIEHDWRFGLRR
jgi:hypothetical protein